MIPWRSFWRNAARQHSVANDPLKQSVLDSSVVLAMLRKERTDDNLLDLIGGAVLSAVNLSEILKKVAEFGIQDAPLLSTVMRSLKRVEPFTASHAQIAADIWSSAPRSGLSFGDRACLALAIELDADVYTADRARGGLQLGCPIHLIR